MAKRVFDLLLAIVGLLLLWPLFLLVWVVIKIDDGGPVLFHQDRVGKDGIIFKILKFRTMQMTAPGKGPSVTAKGDVRITRTGQWLRRSKIDEFPQLWNVIRGDMSFVGPRPEVPHYVALYTEAQRKVLALRPGITDEASIEFRDEEKLLAASADHERFYIEHCMPRKIAVNLAYAQRATLLRDLGVILRTLGAIWLWR
jgi:lipopolysaccharide/colanic/teichoic acid biosynthesis glycosyltransferase